MILSEPGFNKIATPMKPDKIATQIWGIIFSLKNNPDRTKTIRG